MAALDLLLLMPFPWTDLRRNALDFVSDLWGFAFPIGGACKATRGCAGGNDDARHCTACELALCGRSRRSVSELPRYSLCIPIGLNLVRATLHNMTQAMKF